MTIHAKDIFSVFLICLGTFQIYTSYNVFSMSKKKLSKEAAIVFLMIGIFFIYEAFDTNIDNYKIISDILLILFAFVGTTIFRVGEYKESPEKQKIVKDEIEKLNIDDRIEAVDNVKKTISFREFSDIVRTPLHGIIGNADLLMNSKLDFGQREKVLLIMKSAGQMTNIVDNINNIAENGLIMDRGFSQQINLSKILDELRKELRESLKFNLYTYISKDIPLLLKSANSGIKEALFMIVKELASKTGIDEAVMFFELSEKGIYIADIKVILEDSGNKIKEWNKMNDISTYINKIGGVAYKNDDEARRAGLVFSLHFEIESEEKRDAALDTKFAIVTKDKIIKKYLGKIFADNEIEYAIAENMEELIEMKEEIALSETIIIIDENEVQPEFDKGKPEELDGASDIWFVNKKEAETGKAYPLLQKVWDAAVTIKGTSAPEKAREKAYNFRDLKALIIEDNEVNIEILKQYLNYLGAEPYVLMEWNRDEFIKNKQLYDIIFLDIELKNTTGFAVIKELKEFNNAVRVYAVTASIETEMEKRCRDSGFDGFIKKPFTLEEIEKVLSVDFVYKMVEETVSRDVKGEIFLENADRIFGETYHKSIKHISGLVDADKLEEAAKEIHRVKSGAGNLGYTKIYKTLNMLEEMAKKGNGRQMSGILEYLILEKNKS